MAHRKTHLRLDHQGLAVDADVRTAKLSPADIEDRPGIVRRDERTGSLVFRQVYDKATGERLEEGYGFRWVNEHGEEVPSEAIQLYAVEGDRVRPFQKLEPTIGRGRVVEADTWIPVASVDEYLVESVYEIWGETSADAARLYDLAVHIRDFDEAPVVPFRLQPSKYTRWGIITPVFYEETFSLIARVTDRKIEPEHEMPVPPAEAVDAAKRPDPDVRPLQQESPFG